MRKQKGESVRYYDAEDLKREIEVLPVQDRDGFALDELIDACSAGEYLKDFEDDNSTVYYDSNGIPYLKEHDLPVEFVKEIRRSQAQEETELFIPSLKEPEVPGVPEYIEQWQKESLPTEGKKFDDGKPRLDLIPAKAILEEAKVYTFGAQKYDANNWRKGIKFSRLIAAAKRHLNAFEDHTKSDFDHESDLPHLAHAIVNLQMLLQFTMENRIELDDRYRGV